MNALIYAPSGGGKTVNATLVKTGKRGKNLLLCSDNSHIVLRNFKRDNLDMQVIEHWLDRSPDGKDWKSFRTQLNEAIASNKYDNIIVDNISDVFDMAILEHTAAKTSADPRQYYQMVYQDLKRLAREAARVNCNIIFTAWVDEINVTLTDGTQAVRRQPKIPFKILDNFLGLMQIVAYLAHDVDKDKTEHWYLIMAGSQTLYAKDQIFCRKACMPENIFTEDKK